MKVGVLGGGQLGRMLALAGYPLGVSVRLFDSAADACGGQVTVLRVGDYHNRAALDHFADGLDVISYEFENVPVESARYLATRLPARPDPISLQIAQDRLAEKNFFRQQNIPTAEFVAVDTLGSLSAAVERCGLPLVLKTRRMGYDGKGQVVIRSQSEIESAWNALHGVPLIAESFVSFEREVSIIAARAIDGSVKFYSLVENEHRDGILRISRAPAQVESPALQTLAQDYAQRAMETLAYVGVLAIEFFAVAGGLLANEMAPRVHNSGHWTIEGAETSQFENHLRAVTGLPLGSTALRGSSVMMNIIGELPSPPMVLAIDGAHLHLYGKSPRPARKLGHITVRGDDRGDLERRVSELAERLP